MAQQDYAVPKLFLNGGPITQITKVTRMVDAQNQPVNLMIEGLGGWSPGAGMSRLEWEAPPPIGGPEFDYEGMCARKDYVEMQLFLGGGSVASLGKIQSVQTEGSVGNPSSMTIVWEGPLQPTE
jgi:hypothetical protein